MLNHIAHNSEDLDDVPIPQIGTDLFDSLSGDEEPLDGPVRPEVLQLEVETIATVVRMEDDSKPGAAGEQEIGAEESDDDENDDIPAAPMEIEPGPKKGGRASLSASRASTPRTPKSAVSTTGRKRKAADAGEEVPAKRSNGGRATASAALDAIRQASTKRPRAPPGAAKTVRCQSLLLHLMFIKVNHLQIPLRHRLPKRLVRSAARRPAPLRPRGCSRMKRRSTRLRRS